MKINNIYPFEKFNINLSLNFNSNWDVSIPEKVNTLQYFITSKCNYRCPDCFFSSYLGNTDIDFNYYKDYVNKLYVENNLKKINLIGGEPTLHKDINKMIKFNDSLKINTHIYSNGFKIDDLDLSGNLSKVRLSILSYNKIKPITKIKTKLPLTIVYPLTKENINDVNDVINYCNEHLNVSEFVFSTIKKLEKEGDFFDTKYGYITNEEYINFLNDFFSNYTSKPLKEFHINTRGIFDLKKDNSCHFLNKLPDSKETKCPLDIDINIFKNSKTPFTENCHKNNTCLLDKIVLKKII